MSRGIGRREGEVWRRSSYGRAGTSAPWTPNSITLPRIAQFEQQFLSTGAACDAWVDQVAAKNATATLTARPTIVTDPNYAGKQVLDFDGANNFLFTSPSTITGGQNVVTFAWIGHADSVAGVRKIVETGTGGAGSFAIFVEGARLSVYAGGAAGQDYVAGNTPIVAGTRYLFIVEIPWSTLTTDEIKSWVNGTQQTQSVVGNTATNTTFGTKTWIIGRWISAASQYWDGRMAYLDAWSGSLSAGEIALFYAWAQLNYGVA
jgi:hypothetical protein